MLTPQERRALLALSLLLSLGGALRVFEATSPRILSLTLGDSLALGFDRIEGLSGGLVSDAPTAPAETGPGSVAAGATDPSKPSVEPAPGSAPGPGPAYDAAGRLDLNRATAEELETLPGVGPKTAARIVEDRERRGRFKRASDLTRVKGIGPKTLARLLPLVTVTVAAAVRPDSLR
ncbi:MAG: ComEA family DNA-binding protein [Candidatus Eiseniibacteriota bacterium]